MGSVGGGGRGGEHRSDKIHGASVHLPQLAPPHPQVFHLRELS